MVTPRFYKIQLVRGGPTVGLKIWQGFGFDPETGETLERAWHWRCCINGKQVDIRDVAPQFADGTGDSIRGEPITESDYEFYCSDHQWATKYAPTDPAAQPRKKVDMNNLPPIKW